jgi:uncharacterized coiled-coil protein SlyX
MKNFKHLLFITISFLSLSTYAQTSKKTLNYQAVILDPKAIDIPGASITGQPLNKGNVCLRFSLLNASGGLDYEETQQVTTDEFGLVSVAIGTGTQAQAGNSTSIYKSFESIVWNASVKSLKVSVSYDACASFKQVSTQVFNYTPYALYAEAVDYKNVREAPTKLSQFSNDAGYLVPKDLDPLKTDIQSNSSKIATANQTIADNKKASDLAFLVVNQSISSLDKQVAENTNSITTINTKLTEQQNQIVDNRNQIAATNNTMNAQIGGLQGQINITNNTVNNLSGVAEVQSNKSTAVDLGGANPSDQAYPSQKATKTYVDLAIYDAVGSGVPDATTLAAGKVKLSGDLGGTAMNPTVPALANKENTANKSLNVLADGTDNTKYPSVKAVKDYVDAATYGTALAADLANKANITSPAFTGVPTAPTPASSDNSTKLATTAFVQAATAGIALQAAVDAKANIASPAFTGTPTAPTPTLGDNSTKLATTAYVDAQVSAGAADATTTSKGIVKLTGDLGGTATSPTVPGLTLKEDLSNKSNGSLGTSTTLYPTQNAVKTYVDAQVAAATIADADATTKGKLQLTGDLGGTASSPTVPGLTTKANIASPTFTGTVTSPIYASAPQNLTDAATISWDPANGLNANVTLGGNRTLSFSSTPTSGSYGTLVVTQDGTGGRTLTLPSGTNKILGSASTTTIALSSAANAKDILNFYYDGLTSTYYWNVGQGYGIAETVESTNLASSVTGTLPVANGGTGAATATAALTALGAQSSANLSTNISTDAASTSKYPAVKTIKDYVDTQISSATIADADGTTKGKLQLTGDLGGTAASPSVIKLRGTPISSVAPTTAGYVLTYDVNGSATWAAPANSANTISGVVPVTNGGTGLSSLTSGGAVYASSSSALTTGTLPLTAGGTGVTSQQAAINVLTGTQTAGRYLRSDGTDARLTAIQAADVPTLNQNTTGTAANVTGTVALANGGTGATSASAALTALGAAPIASPTFTGTVTAPIYASAPQNLTDAATISWNPTSGLNAGVTLGGNRTLSFSPAPASGSYGTLVITQDGTGGRTLTLPSGTNKVLGSTSTTSVALSTAANAKDILNFYFDGTTYFWNIGQGYGSAATITANNIAGGAAGSIPYQTGAGATGLLAKGNDGQILTLASGVPSWTNASATGVTSVAMTTPTGLTVTGSPITSTGTLALSFTSGYAIPLSSSQTNWDAAYTNRITSASSPLSITSNALSLGTVPVSSGGTGATTLAANNVLLGNGTSALQVVAPGSSGNVLTSNGTTWTSAAGGVPYSGASRGVDLGAYDLTVNGLTVGRGAGGLLANSAVGIGTLGANTTGNSNTAAGYGSLNLNQGGSDNTAFGSRALLNNITGNNNTGVGSYSLWTNTGTGNTAVGYGSLVYNQNGANNVALGNTSLQSNTSGSDNTAVGKFALLSNTTGSFNTAIGASSDVNTNNLNNTIAIGYGARVSASNTIQLGPDGTSFTVNSVAYPTTAITNVRTSGTLTLKDVTYPNTHRSNTGDVLTINGTGTASWAAPSTTATAYSGTLPIGNGGTNSTATPTNGGVAYGTGTALGYSSAGTSGQVMISAGAAAPTWATLQAGSAITISNSGGVITIAAAIRPISDEFTATAGQTVFALSQTPLTNPTTSPVRPNVWMFINGVRTKNLAYAVSGTTVTYTASSNNSYTLVAGDRIQFDYAY